MSGDKIKLIIIGILVLLNIVVLMSGCALLQRVTDAIFESDRKPIVVETPKEQLWQAVKNSNWLVTISIIGIAAGFFAFLNGSKIGLPAIGASCVSLFMALAVARFALWMAIFGMIGSLASVIISILVKNKALKEIVFGVQKVKDITPETDNHLKNVKTILAKQVKSTKKIVAKIKDKARLKGEL